MQKTYRYRIKTWITVIAGLFFAACTWALWKDAVEGVTSLQVFKFITLGPVAGTALLWLLTATSVGFVAVSVLGFAKSLSAEDAVVIDATGITAPNRLLFGRQVHVPYRDITRMTDMKVKRERILTIHHTEGKLGLSARGFDSGAAFDEARQTLIDRVAALGR